VPPPPPPPPSNKQQYGKNHIMLYPLIQYEATTQGYVRRLVAEKGPDIISHEEYIGSGRQWTWGETYPLIFARCSAWKALATYGGKGTHE